MQLAHFADQIRLHTLKMLEKRGFGHYGGSLSIVETLAVLYGEEMKVYPENPLHEERDYFVLSKGHGGPALYSTLALKGFFPLEMLNTLNENGTLLPSHPDRMKTAGVDMTTGSLGQGISVATGLAWANQLDAKDNYTYTIVGDGELNEGQCWEAIQFAAHHELSKFILFVDYNKKQLDGYVEDICRPYDYVEKFKAFGFHAVSVDGASVNAIQWAVQKAKQQKRPTAIILDTVKGQGVKHLEEKFDNHHIRPSEEDAQAIAEAILELERKVAM